ncbi:MAG: imidazole glycerol phosphate synthase subunit HisF [Spirochaetales bacterium]|jgi:cyclase|nr:imidazole glycerol phosphate synthase subunit HisF [Spirochaetales bacterium]
MLEKRIVVCLDVRDGKTTKGIRFKDNQDIGDPVEMAREYYLQGVDELVFYDITASAEGRGIMIDVVRRVAREIFIPFCVGGGLASVEDMREVLLAGAEKVSLNSQAVKNPGLISAGARLFGNQCIVLGMDVKSDPRFPSGYGVLINGGRTETGRDALEWAREAESLGAGEIVLNSVDADGTREGYELRITRLISGQAGIPVVASGGGGRPEHLAEVLTTGQADAALIASMVHYGDYRISGLKDYLFSQGVPVRRV